MNFWNLLPQEAKVTNGQYQQVAEGIRQIPSVKGIKL